MTDNSDYTKRFFFITAQVAFPITNKTKIDETRRCYFLLLLICILEYPEEVGHLFVCFYAKPGGNPRQSVPKQFIHITLH